MLVMAGCATRAVPPPLPPVLKYPEFAFPAVPPALRQLPGAERIDRGWRFLQNDDLRNAEREFAAAVDRSPALYPAHAGEGYVALARRDHARALLAFDAALRDARGYAPALVGRGQALLELNRDADALAAFEAAVAADPSLASLRRRIEVLRFRNVQDVIEAARTAAAAGRLDEARLAYGRAITASPESAFLHRELGLVEQKRGDADAALAQFRRAAELDPSDAASLADIGDLLDQRQDFDGALEAYRRAAAIEPGPDLAEKIARVTEKAREARLPPEFHAIPASESITRGELAALIGVRFEDPLRTAPAQDVVITDAADHWAAAWIAPVARARVIEVFENHMFQPRAPVRRGDLASAVARLVTLMAADRPQLRQRIAQRPKIADMNTGHLSYPAVALAVASGAMPLLEGDRFQVSRVVSGAEAVEVIERLRMLQ
jgi:tetratricopeptide (TPR) repeat protein